METISVQIKRWIFVKTYSIGSFVADTVAVFGSLYRSTEWPFWVGRVKSMLNVADIPARNLPAPCEVEHISDFRQIIALPDECLSRLG